MSYIDYDLEVEAITLVAIAEAMENGENAPEEYAIAIHGVAHRLKEFAKGNE